MAKGQRVSCTLAGAIFYLLSEVLNSHNDRPTSAGLSKSLRLEVSLPDSREPPRRARRGAYSLAPRHHCLVLVRGALPDAALRLNDPVGLPGRRLLHDHPVRMIEADCPTGLQVVHSELAAG